ncbi:MAG: MATE family efflux transporter [Pedobacter sp.]
MRSKDAILKDKLGKLMYQMSLPGIMSMLVISLNSFVDAVFAGRIMGADALAGVSLSMPLLVVNSALTGFISSGASNVLSRAIGNGNEYVTKNIFTYVLIYTIGVSFILGVLGFAYARPLMMLMGAETGVLEEGTLYYKWMMAGCVTSIFGLGVSALIRAEGLMKFTMRVTAVSVLINIILNPILMGYFGLGVMGSAWATIISMAIYSASILYYLLSGRSAVTINLNKFKADWVIISAISSVGISALVMQLNNFLRQIFLFKTVTLYNNSSEVAFFSAVFRIFSFSVIPIFGMLQAMQPIVGINYGAGNYERSISALKLFRIACSSLMLLILIPVFLFPEVLLSLILPKMEFSEQNIFHFRLLMCILPLAPISSTSMVFLQGTGNAKIATYLALGREMVLFIPLLILLPTFAGKSGVYYGLFIENILYMLIVFFVVRRQTKRMISNTNLTYPILNATV